MVVKKFDECNVPVKMWIDNVEEGAMKQLKRCASLPFVFSHVVACPDIHPGIGISIGTVLATKDVIVPNAIGSDIGCGMCAIQTSLTSLNLPDLKKIMGEIRKKIPVGFKKQEKPQNPILMPITPFGNVTILYQEVKNSLLSLGTLGGGNHFIEIQKGSDGFIWIMVHSGSRNLGKRIADHYNKLAVELNQKWYSSIPKEWELAFLPIDSKEGQAYIDEMQYAVKFALANRKLMMTQIIDSMKEVLKTEFQEYDFINIAHNYARLENHFGTNVWVHRKGATSAKKDEIGIIPGSQGTKSYIVKGKGNIESFESCSHGAGRLMSRNKAKTDLVLADEIKRLDSQGIVHGIRTVEDLDEASGAYKDISVVMENQKDLVDIQVELTPLAVIKG